MTINKLNKLNKLNKINKMSEVKRNTYQWNCAHCIWNNNVERMGKNAFGKPEFFGKTENLNIFSMFGKLRYTFNFVSKTHKNSYNDLEHLKLINEVKKYAQENFINSKYNILHNSGFNLKKYGGKEHIHILLTILPGNQARKNINNKYNSIQGLPKYLIKNSLNNILKKNNEYIGNNNRIEIIIQEITEEIKEIKSDDIENYETRIENIFSKYLGYDFTDIINLLTKESISFLYGDGFYRQRENITVDENYSINFENISKDPVISLIGSDSIDKHNKIFSYLSNVIENENKNNINKKLFTTNNADYLEYYLLLKKNDDQTFYESLLYSYESMDLENLIIDSPSYLWLQSDGRIITPSNSTQMVQLKKQINDIKDILNKNIQEGFNKSLEILSSELDRLSIKEANFSTGKWT
jgi:hypothetical protein